MDDEVRRAHHGVARDEAGKCSECVHDGAHRKVSGAITHGKHACRKVQRSNHRALARRRGQWGRRVEAGILASGIEPRKPAIPGIDHKSVVGYADLISGRAAAGRNVVIIGAGGIGFDTALYLLERSSRSMLDGAEFNSHWGISRDNALAGGLDPAGMAKPHPSHSITMLKRSATPFGNTLGRTTGWVHRAELAKNGVKMIKGVAYRHIDDAGVHITVDDKENVIPADTIVLCAGQEPKRELKATHLIGGAKEAGELDAKRAMREGAELAARL